MKLLKHEVDKLGELSEQVIHINRVAKTVKGGRNMRFTALVAVGDGNGHVGIGTGKAQEVPEAIRKGTEAAKKNMVKISLVGTTIPHEVLGKYGAGSVLLKPAAPGTGIIAGGPVRAVCELAGLRDVRSKNLGSSTPRNIVNATMEGLSRLVTIEQVAKKRGKTVEEIVG